MKKMVFCSVIVGCFLSPAFAQIVTSSQDSSHIYVSGSAVVQVVPDKIIIYFGIVTLDTDISKSKNNNNDIYRKAVEAIKKTGLQEKDIQTDRLSIRPQYRTQYSVRTFLGYETTNSFSVTLTQLDKVELLITEVLKAGVTEIKGIEFHTTEYPKHREEARTLALQAAREKAQKMAAIFDMQIGKPVSISEGRAFDPLFFSNSWESRSSAVLGNANMVRERSLQDVDISDTLALGKISIKAQVSVTFELKNPS
ncbi:SIMPL domain-containing protein [Planctomycetota bacterium]